MNKFDLAILQAMAEFQNYIKENIGEEIDIQTIRAFAEMYVQIVDNLKVKDEQ